MLVDTHAHLYHEGLAGDLDAVARRAVEAGVTRILLPAIDRASAEAALGLCARYPGLYAMAGIHPSHVHEEAEGDWDALVALASRPEVVAVGETGLDYYWTREHAPAQHASLRRHVRLAIDARLPLVLHNRDEKGSEASSRDLVRVLREERAAHAEGEALRGVFHCFGGPAWLADEALGLGFFLGLGGSLTFKNGGVPEAIEGVPLSRIVLETDAPYLAPVPFRGKRNEPAHVALVAEKLADLRGISPEAVARETTAAAEALFGLPPA